VRKIKTNGKLFSVIIVSFNKMQILIDCLNSLLEYNDIGDLLEIIVVENSPEEDIYIFIKENYKKVKIIKNNNRGFGEGNNVGANVASGKYLLFLNPDTILIQPIFQFAIDKFQESNELAMFGVKLVDEKLVGNFSFYYLDKFGIIETQLIKLYNALDIFISDAMYIAGADIFIRKDIFYECGMFDENIFMFYEEHDLTKRVTSLNKRIAYFKQKRIIHLDGKTRACLSNTREIVLQSCYYYCKKHGQDFNKRVNFEIRYNWLKLCIYRITNRNKFEECKNNIRILKSFHNYSDA
jgi:GT2 family glycosyltransferase